MKSKSSNFDPNVDIVDSILRHLHDDLNRPLLRQILNREESKFRSLTEEFQYLKEIGEEGPSTEMVERLVYQLVEVLELFGVQHDFDFLVNLNSSSPQYPQLVDNSWHISNLLWSASQQSSDETFSSLYDRVPKEVDDLQLFNLIEACLINED